MGKIFVVDVDKCNGCYSCQVVCKDEHCEQSWMPYAEAEPLTGQFWCGVEEIERGQVPVVRLSYIPHMDAQNDAIGEYAPECVQEREDGVVVIDPVASKGRKDIAEKFNGVFWNEELQICQGCTGCAHLLDNGWNVPRCVDACPTDALRFGDEADFAEELKDATQLDSTSRVYYLNYPKRFVAGLVYDPEIDEVVRNAVVRLMFDGECVSEAKTDEFGDFRFEQIEAQPYKLEISADGYESISVDANVSERDLYVGDLELAFTADRRDFPTAEQVARYERAEAEIKWAKMRKGMQKPTKSNEVAVICPVCGKKVNTGIDAINAGAARCQFCKADLTDAILDVVAARA